MDLLNEIKENNPNWIKYVLDDFSDDYKGLKNNWVEICKMLKTKRKKIIIVENIFNDENNKKMCDLLGTSGYCVRTLYDYFPCPICNLALPTKFVHNMLVKCGKYDNICPYSDKCSSHI